MLQNIQRIYCRPQNYAWGKLATDPECLVYKLSNIKDLSKRYAELWMGSHPSLPSLDENNQPISVNLPYLFKVLSIDQVFQYIIKPLSIQIHPNKEQAILLHQAKPHLYPDDNHKPEMAIALTDFESLIGFAEPQIIINNLEKNPKLIQELGEDLWNSFKQNPSEFLQVLVTKFLSFNQDQLGEILGNFAFPSICCSSLNQQITNYDIGYLFLLIMNHVTLHSGQAVLLEAGLIHSYLKGNIIEVMANSDNVVRCGFTPKEKDIETMKQILKCSMSKPNLVQPTVDLGNSYEYRNYVTQYQEFACEYLKLSQQDISKEFKLKKNTIMLCIRGNGTILNGQNELEIQFGYTYLINQESELKFRVIDELELYCCYF